MGSMTIEIDESTFRRLQKLAVPLVDNNDTVVQRLIRHWEANPPKSSEAAAPEKQRVWLSSRGEALPVAPLRASYLGKMHEGKVTPAGIDYNGKTYISLSRAAIAVKNAAGTKGRSASTNGWDFWEILNPRTKQWVPTSALRKANKVDVDALFKELDQAVG